MTAALPMTHPHLAHPGPTVHPATITLFDGSTLTITNTVPLTAAGRRHTALGALLYCYGGRIDHPNGFLGAYLGQSADLNGPRPAKSLTHWVVTQRRIIPAGAAFLRRTQPYDDDYRRYVEARTIMTLSSAGLWMLNTHTSAGKASSRLTRAQVREGQHLATDIAHLIRDHLFDGQNNPHPSPAANTREAAVREVCHAGRAVDTFEVMRALRKAGYTTSKGRSWDFSLRRDLNLRERETRGVPRVVSTWHRNRRVFWDPTTLTKRQALHGYDLAHP